MRLRLVSALCSLALLGTAPLPALEPYLVQDINPVAQNQSSSPREFVSLENGIALFVADLDPLDPEIWRSDGTAAGTYRLTETCSTWFCSQPFRGVAKAGDRFFFLAATEPGFNARELWVTGGSTGDTVALGGPFILNPDNPPLWVKSRRLLFFVADDGEHGMELWRSDGTPAGTYRLTDFREGDPYILTDYRGKLYLAGPTARGWNLWVSDGTSRGTRLLKDASNYALRSIGSTMVFFGPGPGWNLWRSDGTPKGTVKIATIARDAADMQILEVVALAGRYYFTTQTRGQGEELWASDGTPAGTRRVTNFANPMPFHYDDETVWHPLYLPTLAAGSKLVFAADDGVHGAEPWVTDGTPAGTRLLRDVCPGACWSWPVERANIGSRLIFSASTTAQGGEPWVTDGTPAGTRLLRDLCPGQCHSRFFGMVPLAGGLLFGADDGQNGLQLWKTNGTPRGTTRITAFPEEVSTLHRIGASIPGAVLYSASTRQDGAELWHTDGTAAGTRMVLDLVDKDNGGSRPGDLFSLGSRLLFLADDGLHGRELWTSDGTGAGTRMVRDTPPYPNSSPDRTDITGWAEMEGIGYMTGETSEGYGLWRTDGTEAGTYRLTPERASADRWVMAAGNRVFFSGFDPEHGLELWISDGTAAGTRGLDLSPGEPWSNPERPVVFQGALYVHASGSTASNIWRSDGSSEGMVPVPFLQNSSLLREHAGRLWFRRWTQELGTELWSTDGTEAGTRLFADFQPGTDSWDVTQLISAGSRMFLMANNELWVSDGTVEGTRKIGPGTSLELARVLDGKLFFVAPVEGDITGELWMSDGTVAGTQPLLDSEGHRFAGMGNLISAGGRIWFVQNSKLWQTDGTTGGTVERGTAGQPYYNWSELVAVGDRLFYPRWTPEIGHELWAIGLN